MDIQFRNGELTASEQHVVSEGFRCHTDQQNAPQYRKESVKWVAFDEQGDLSAVLAADILWDWMYIDEIWVSRNLRGEGVGRRLMQRAEAYAKSRSLEGIWLWTQSWQAEGFYRRLGYSEFTRFDDFPQGYSRIGFRKRV